MADENNNLITNMLRQAAARVELDKHNVGNQPILNDPSSIQQQASAPDQQPSQQQQQQFPQQIDQVLSDPAIVTVTKYKAKTYVYPPQVLMALRESPLIDISHLTLPEDEFYRFNARLPRMNGRIKGNHERRGSFKEGGRRDKRRSSTKSDKKERSAIRKQLGKEREHLQREHGGHSFKEQTAVEEEEPEWMRAEDTPTACF
ncbi:unnamed protein product [Ambrosiozyma monospora]|uniref:Unnamed protein product n=1 Tax=Ambrosiozyma monospora TaxID=43982 RepID=A0A9W7DBN1_AMBMO|nr:unnamed protein product [Ambrosiozyma monospora]